VDDDNAVRTFLKERGLSALQSLLDEVLRRKLGREKILRCMEEHKGKTPETHLGELEERYEGLLKRLFPPDAAGQASGS
jgi:hypothetical protein